MNEPGISVNEACALRAKVGSGYLTDSDFARQCNADGTVKQASEVTTFTNGSTYLYLGATLVLIAGVIAILVVLRRRSDK